MRQTTMDGWIEAAEAKRVYQMAYPMPARSIAPTPHTNPLMTKLRSMFRLQISDRHPAHAPVPRTAA